MNKHAPSTPTNRQPPIRRWRRSGRDQDVHQVRVQPCGRDSETGLSVVQMALFGADDRPSARIAGRGFTFFPRFHVRMSSPLYSFPVDI